jgi:hypothetical protein
MACLSRTEKGQKMYVFPKDPVRRRIWERHVNRKYWSATDNSRLCEKHFEICYFVVVGKTRKLSKDAIPTIFDPKALRKNARVQQNARMAVKEHDYAAEWMDFLPSNVSSVSNDSEVEEEIFMDCDNGVETGRLFLRLQFIIHIIYCGSKNDLNKTENHFSPYPRSHIKGDVQHWVFGSGFFKQPALPGKAPPKKILQK